MTQATELRELATLLDISSGNVGIGLPSGTASNKLVISDGVRTSAAITAGTTALEIARTGGGDVGILINKDIAKWLIGIDNSDGNAAPLRFMYGAYNAAAHPGFGADYSGLNLTYDGKVGIGTKVPNYELHVKGAGDIKIEDSAGGSAHLRIGASTSSLRNSEWKVKVSGPLDEFHIDHDYTANNGSADVAVGTNVFKLTSDDNVEIANDVLTNNAKLKTIAKDISDTQAVDVFVYDTRKDSDGGAWRKRTQNTSWYNETLNTSTRGARKEFPSVAVIVTESNKVTIYDGDDPDMPMWMVFDGGARQNMIYGLSDNSQKATKMLNGLLVSVGNDSGGQGGTFPISFIADNGYFLSDASNSPYKYNGNIEQRNDSLSISTGDSGNYGVTVSRYVNDVAMTVLPNAPIDSVTGLPVPTIAVATNGGVSVITDSGAVYDSDYTEAIRDVAFDGDNTLFYVRNASSYLLLMAEPSEYASGDGFGTGIASSGVGGQEFDLISARSQTTMAFSKGFVASGGVSSTAGSRLLGLYDIDKSNLTNTMAAGIHYDYNTGWMHGDIKLATLSDTDNTNLGAELAGLSTLSGTSRLASHTYTSGATTFSLTEDSNSSTAAGYVWLLLNVPEGGQYTVSIQCDTAFTAQGDTRLVSMTGGNVFPGQGTTDLRSLTFSGSLSTTGLILYSSPVAGSTVTYTVSVKEAAQDRSVNKNGLQVFGTVTKTVVATGADLMAYSGFSSSNYLEQPYNSDLDFGTGDFSYMYWVDGTGGTYDSIVCMGDSGVTANDGHGLRTGPSNVTFQWWANNSVRLAITGFAGVWQNVCFVRQGGYLSGYINGEFVAGTLVTNDLNTMTNPTMMVGNGTNKSSTLSLGSFGGSLALLRISATAPSAEQIAKMYNDEKHLFRENAKATLYGTSDAVTALAYDDDTELLHVGTSAGRSVFQGLNRVDNTTDAVGAAISASNGLVAED